MKSEQEEKIGPGMSLSPFNRRRSGIYCWDLDSCAVRTIRGANVDLLKCRVSEKLNSIPPKCFICAGLYDLMNNMDPDCILDNLTALVSELKEKNNKI